MKRAVVVLAAMMCVAIAAAALGATEIIIDNPSASFVGAWETGTMSTDKYGSDYQYILVSTSGGSTATFTPDIPSTSNDWEVYVWYPQGTNRPTQAQIIVHHAGGNSTFYVNQQTNGGKWNYLGAFTMDAGTSSYAQVTNYGSETTKVVLADAFRFYSASGGSEDTTPPVISSVSATPSSTSAVVTWTTNEPATSQVEYGLTTSYGSQTTKDTSLVMSHSVTITELSISTLYHYRVKSDDAAGNPATSGDYTFTTTAQATGEDRTMWANTWNNGILSASQNTTLVSELSGANYNAVIPEIRKCGDAYFTPAPIFCPVCNAYHQEPRASNIIDPLPFDPLQDLLAKAHSAGVEVHGWLVTYRIWNSGWGAAPTNHVWYSHSNWAMKTSSGGILDGTMYNLDPGIPAVQDYICKVAVDIVTRYDIDGINWDYVRYPGTTWGYNEITKQRFYNEYGYYPPTSSSDTNWTTWCNYRRQQVTDLVKKVYLEIMAVNPRVKHSVDTVGWMGADPNTSYTSTAQYSSVFQDARSWMLQHIIDMNILMNYKREADASQAADYDLWTNWLASIQSSSGRSSVDGNAAYLNTISNTIHQMTVARNAGIGLGNYDYASTNNEGKTRTEFLNSVKSSVHQTYAPPKNMPWKTAPTTGIIFGAVTDASKPNDSIYLNWIYKATVQVTGPVTRSTLTDGTGTYGFMDLPPGTYNIAVSKTGFPTRTYYSQTINAGDVLREDFDLGYTTCSSAAGAANTGWTLFSLPLEPVDPDPAVVLPGIRLDTCLYRWDNASQSQYMYDEWAPGIFGNLNTNEGYWLTVASAYTISYQAYGGNATMRDISLPSAGWTIVGCPFQRDVSWEDIMVTNGGTTVSMQTATKTNNWLSSTGYWWDSAYQSQYDIGIAEDWPYTTQMHPWHGYWLQSYVNGLTLTLR